MANLIHTVRRNEAASKKQSNDTILNSAIKYRKNTLDYNKIRNQVDQNYYHKLHGCSVKTQE